MNFCYNPELGNSGIISPAWHKGISVYAPDWVTGVGNIICQYSCQKRIPLKKNKRKSQQLDLFPFLPAPETTGVFTRFQQKSKECCAVGIRYMGSSSSAWIHPVHLSGPSRFPLLRHRQSLSTVTSPVQVSKWAGLESTRTISLAYASCCQTTSLHQLKIRPDISTVSVSVFYSGSAVA